MLLKRKILLPVVCCLYAGLFTYTAVSKLADLNRFRADLNDSPLVGPLDGVLTWLIPVGELILSVFLFVPTLRKWGLRLSVILMGIFTGYIFLLMNVSPSVSCSCGGFIERMGPVSHLLFNCGFILIGLSGLFADRKYLYHFKILRAQSSRSAGRKKTGEAENLWKRVGVSFLYFKTSIMKRKKIALLAATFILAVGTIVGANAMKKKAVETDYRFVTSGGVTTCNPISCETVQNNNGTCFAGQLYSESTCTTAIATARYKPR